MSCKYQKSLGRSRFGVKISITQEFSFRHVSFGFPEWMLNGP